LQETLRVTASLRSPRETLRETQLFDIFCFFVETILSLQSNSFPMATNPVTKEDLMQEQILSAARELFQKFGRDKVTMDDVAKAIGKGRSSLYYYYKNKDEVWVAVMTSELGEVLAAILQAVNEAPTLEEKLFAFCITKLKMMRKKRALYHITVATSRDASANVKTNPARRRAHLKKESLILNQILTDGMNDGELTQVDKKEQDILVFVLLSGLHGLEKEMEIEKGYNLEPAIRTLTNMILNGLRSK
jgi:AcrR family transcriptional regulator